MNLPLESLGSDLFRDGGEERFERSLEGHGCSSPEEFVPSD